MSVASARFDHSGQPRDEGAVLIFVLVVVLLISLISVPMLGYISSVFRYNQVQAERSQAIELANGGVWVALSTDGDLYDACPSRAGDAQEFDQIPLDGVVVTCHLIDVAPLRPATEVPFHVSTVAADAQVPAAISSLDGVVVYTNPSTEADPGAWLADRTSLPELGHVWIPQLAVQASSPGDDRMTEMRRNSFDPGYDSCRVFFPGTYNTEIVIAEPTYFTSGVYSFTEPIVLRDGADVVVGNGAEPGCTNDFEAIGNAVRVPDQLNMSGLGGTFVLGGSARITVDDAGGDDIRFIMNQRYVSSEEVNVAASSDVAIVSVNGTHEPLRVGEELGHPLFVPGAIDVPASTVGTEDNPLAADSGYLPSTLTLKPSVPDAPTILTADDFRIGSDGRVTVSWSEPESNGAPVRFYEVTDEVTGQTCRTLRPGRVGAEVRPTCTLRTMPDGVEAVVTVTATNQHGTSRPSEPFAADRVVLSGSSLSPEVPDPTAAPVNPTIQAHSDGAFVEWTRPDELDGAPIGFSEVLAVDAGSGVVVSCRAAWNENGCALLTSEGFEAGSTYDVTVRSFLVDGDLDRVYLDQAPRVTVDPAYSYSAAGGPAPQPSSIGPTGLVDSSAILDFSTSTDTRLRVRIDGYIAVPQGRLELDAAVPDRVSVSMTGGVVAGSIELDPGAVPSDFNIRFDNPTAQKRVRIVSDVTASGIRADAVIQLNRSGSVGINSWVVGSANNTTTPAPDSGDFGDDEETPVEEIPVEDTYLGGGVEGVEYGGGDPGDPTVATDPHLCDDATRWSVSYWNNPDLAGRADVELCDDDVDENWGAGEGPATASDFFSARWIKTVDVPATNVYDFTFRVDDGVRLWIDGALVHDDWDAGDTSEVVPVELAAGTHVFEVEYREQEGNARASMTFAESLSCDDPTFPWLGRFHDGQVPAGPAAAERCDAAIDFDWGSGAGPTGASDDFSARWVRTLSVPEAGDYQMLIGGDDRVRVFVDGIEIPGQWGSQPYSESAFVTSLSAGDHEIAVEYSETVGNARVKFDIQPVSPPPAPTCSGAGEWSGTYFDGRDLSVDPIVERCDAAIDFDWGSGEGPTGSRNDFSARWARTIEVPASGEYSLTIGADDGIRVFVDGVDVYSDWRNGSFRSETVSIPLQAGPRDVVVEYYEQGGRARVLADFDIGPAGPGPEMLFQTASDAIVTGDFQSDGRGWGVPNGGGSSINNGGPGGTANSITFTFMVTQPGDYRMNGSVRSPSGNDDSFWVTANGTQTNAWMWWPAVTTTYAPSFVTAGGNVREEVIITLAPGTHEVTVYEREDGTYIESMELVPVP